MKNLMGLLVFGLCGLGLYLTHDYKPPYEPEWMCNFNGTWCKQIGGIKK